ncbi:MAG TPA: mechanosensitive ion channel family protein [Thermodesulfobacteriota bacterium]|nr:mechanosensitive ion channel family protein [Thermodesulfobacteriota bacterium]
MILATALAVCLGNSAAVSQTSPETAPKGVGIVEYLTQTISWYRGTAVEQQISNEPTDVTFLNENRRTSSEVVRLAFDFARQAEKNESVKPKEEQTQGRANVPSQNQRLIQAVTKADQQVEQSQSELQSLRQKMASAPERKRPALESLIAETQSELAFRQARRDALRDILQFTAGTSIGGADLRTQIEELARSVPASLSGAGETSPEQPKTEQTLAGMPPPGSRQQASGIWGLVAELFRLSRKAHTLGQQIQSTDHLMLAAKQLRDPLVTSLRSLIQSGDQLANQPPSADPSVVTQQKKQMDALTAQFKQTSSGLLPLRKQTLLLNLYKTTLTNWRDAVQYESHDVLRSFLIRLGLLVLIIAAIFAVGAAWRRAIFRYVHETRRRYQFLLFRKIVIWVALGAVIAFTLAAELGSIATFAGLLTAGVAVALQNVILSVAGYFFLIGKYGIRVGDRVQIAGVTGEVVDIGIVRFHLLELGSGGTDAQPSGRVVAFSNSVVFQPASSVFKQIPGTSFVWHEMSLTFSPEGNYRTIQERITTAVDTALKDHREEMEQQRRHMEQTLNSISTIELRPRTRLHITASGIEVWVRFPVGLQNAADIDDRVLHEIYAAIDREPKLKLVESGMPTLRTDISTPTPA